MVLADNVAIRAELLARRPLAVDLFSGVGGLSLGLELAGFFSAIHVEVEEEASRYAEFNFPLAMHLAGPDAGDVRNLSGELISKMLDGREVSLVAGGPPCQGFSRIGRQRVDDPLNDLVLEMARVILELRPRAFVIENVPGSLDSRYWQFSEAINRLSVEYVIHDPQTLRAEDFGVPQKRRRVFTIGTRRDLGVQPPRVLPTHSPSPDSALFDQLERTASVADAIFDLPNCDDYEHLLDRDDVAYTVAPHSEYARAMRLITGLQAERGYAVDWDDRTCTNLRRTQHGPELTAALSALPVGATEKKSRIPRLDPTGLSVTIRAGTTSSRGSWSAPRPCHPVYPRVLSTRECARLQSFPDWFRFHPVKWHGNRQVGNAVPPLLGRAVGAAILEVLGRVPEHAPLGVVTRDTALISGDIEAAANGGNAGRRVSHKVVNTGAKNRIR